MKTFKQLREESTALQPVKMMVVFSDGERKSYSVPKDTSFKDYVEKKIVPVEQGRDVVHYGVDDKPNTTKTTITSVKEAWEKTGKEGTHRESGEKTFEYKKVKTNKDGDVEETGERCWKNASGKMMGEDVESLDEISAKLAGEYYGAVSQQHVKKVGMKPNMYDRVEKDLGKKRKEGIDRAFSRITKQFDVKESFQHDVDHMPGAVRHDLSNVKNTNKKDNVHSTWGTLEKAQSVADKHGLKVKKNSYVDPYDKKTKFEYRVIKESDEAYAAAEKAKEEKRKMDNITPSDKKTLGKIAALLDKEKKQVKEDVLVEYKATNYEYKNKAGKTANLASITWGDGDVEHITTTMGGRPTRHSTKDKAHASLRVRGFEPTGEVTNEAVELDEGMNDITPQDASDIIHIHGGKKDFKALRPKAQTDLDNLAHDYGIKSKSADKSHGHHFWDKLHIKASRLSEAVEKDPIAIAKSASDKAGKSGSRQNHNLAAQAHGNAAKYCEQKGDDEAAEFHRQRASFHTNNSLG